MLQVRIPKAALPQPKKIQITAGVIVNGGAKRAVGSGKSR